MTVDQWIKKLKEISEQGDGNLQVVCHDDDTNQTVSSTSFLGKTFLNNRGGFYVRCKERETEEFCVPAILIA